MQSMLKKTLAALAIGSAVLSANVMAADYVVDKEGQHAFVDFKISHLGYSFITGTFKDIDGKFSFPAAKLAVNPYWNSKEPMSTGPERA